MYIRSTQCCALDEIFGLSDHKSAEDAMSNFCSIIVRMDNKVYTTGLYLFTGVIKHTDGSEAMTNFTYGPNFAAFIRDNKLGKVRGSWSAPNIINHPTHVVRAWIWCPDRDALTKWYKKVKK